VTVVTCLLVFTDVTDKEYTFVSGYAYDTVNFSGITH